MDVIEHYSRLYAKYGDDPRAVQLSDGATQRRRFAALCEIVRGGSDVSILDVGCGLGHLAEFLTETGFTGSYTGIDIVQDFVSACRKKLPQHEFDLWDISAQPFPRKFEYVLASGIFNNQRMDALDFLQRSVKNMYDSCLTATAFNFMSTYVDYFDAELAYFEPERLFSFCKQELSPLVTLRNDYCVKPDVVPFEALLYVHRTTIGCRSSPAT